MLILLPIVSCRVITLCDGILCHVCFFRIFTYLSGSPPPHPALPRDDEHALILQYCQTLGGEGGSPSSQPQSPAQILQAVEREERGELGRVIARLEEDQR